MIKIGEVAGNVAFALAMLDPAERAVVENHDHNPEILFYRAPQSVETDRESAVSADGNDLALRIDELRSQRDRDRGSHVRAHTGLKKCARSFCLEEMTHKDAVLARITCHDGIVRHSALDLFDNAL